MQGARVQSLVRETKILHAVLRTQKIKTKQQPKRKKKKTFGQAIF